MSSTCCGLFDSNYHGPSSEISADPLEASFVKWLPLCDGVLLVSDRDATPFTRIWCLFEALVAERKELLQARKLTLVCVRPAMHKYDKHAY